MTIREAVSYIGWYAASKCILHRDELKFQRALHVVRSAAGIITIARGPQGPMEVIEAKGSFILFRDRSEDKTLQQWGFKSMRCVLGELSESQYLTSAAYPDGILVLTSNDANQLGIQDTLRKHEKKE